MALFIAYLGLQQGQRARLELADPFFELRPDLYLVQTGLTRSRLYHAIKRKLPPDTALLVAELAKAPKFKGMADGALKWVRGLD